MLKYRRRTDGYVRKAGGNDGHVVTTLTTLCVGPDRQRRRRYLIQWLVIWAERSAGVTAVSRIVSFASTVGWVLYFSPRTHI